VQEARLVNSLRPRLHDYELLLQLGHTVDYQTYLVRRGTSPQLLALRQSRKDRDVVDTRPLESVLEVLRIGTQPNLPRVTDFGVEDDRLFWVSDYVEGDTLDVLDGRTLQVPSDVAVRLCVDVATALQGLGKLGTVGPLLRHDVHVGVDGVARVIPPLTWDNVPRRELQALAATLPTLPPEVVYLCAFLWESVSGLALPACRESEGWPLVSTFGVQLSPELDGLISDVLHGRARFGQLKTFVSVVEQCAQRIASRQAVEDWLLGLIRARLASRTHVLRSRIPTKPSGEIPLVQVPTDLDTARFAASVGQLPVETDPPLPLPTIRTPQPFASGEEPLDGPPSSVRSAADAGASPPRRAREPSSVPPSSVRATLVTPPIPADVTRRAPLESALAEFAERAGVHRKQ
jgi:hypothetical protein